MVLESCQDEMYDVFLMASPEERVNKPRKRRKVEEKKGRRTEMAKESWERVLLT